MTLNRQTLAWAFYDWGNSAFATVVMAGFFPLFFRDFWSAGTDSATITLNLGIANSLGSLVIVAAAPMLGAIADRGGSRKRFLATFAGLGVMATAMLVPVPLGAWQQAAIFYVLGTVGFMGANVFYDSLLVDIAPAEHYDTASALGFALGYLGGGLLFALCVWMSLTPSLFGLADTSAAVRLSFLLVALWWALFTVPLMVSVAEPNAGRRLPLVAATREGWYQLRATIRQIRQYRAVALFLLAYWLYIDGVDTIVRMAVDYGRALGFDRKDLILALLITQFVGFPAAIAFGVVGERLGTRRGILIGLAGYVVATVLGSRIDAAWQFYLLALAIGLVQGGVQSLSRAFYARLIPPDRSAEFFGFYNMLGKFAAVLGPVTVGWVGALSDSPRLGVLSLLFFFIAGAWLLSRVPADR